MKRVRGITLLEVLVTAAITVIVLLAAVQAMAAGIGYNERLRSGRDTEESRRRFEERLTLLLTRAYIDSADTKGINPNSANATGSTETANTRTCFFVGQTGAGMPPGQTIAPGQLLIPGQATQAAAAGAQTNGSTSAGNADTLMFTVMGRPLPGSVLAEDPSDDFETTNQHYGPQGGLAEYAISMTPVGDAQGQKGVILREQLPADEDATQGGYESVIEPDVTSLTFEFFDGTAWQPSWNTFAQTTRQLPAAVRVTYSLTGESQNRIFIVGLACSTVTPNNPATTTGGN